METHSQTPVALVTGGSSGIGKATALAFAKSGATVVVADVLEEEGKKVVASIEEQGGTALFIYADMADIASIGNLMQRIEDQFGRLDAAFNNAGVEGDQGGTADCSFENWERVININLRGVWTCMKYEIPLMLKHGGGAIVNCASIAGLVGFPGIPAYSASKHGVVGLTKTAALEYARRGIRVNAVCPGVIKTPMIDRFTGGNVQAETQFSEGAPMGRMGAPEEIAETVVWLCSPKASFLTGQAIAVDGGWVVQ